jgi:hypothetical protein
MSSGNVQNNDDFLREQRVREVERRATVLVMIRQGKKNIK